MGGVGFLDGQSLAVYNDKKIGAVMLCDGTKRALALLLIFLMLTESSGDAESAKEKKVKVDWNVDAPMCAGRIDFAKKADNSTSILGIQNP